MRQSLRIFVSVLVLACLCSVAACSRNDRELESLAREAIREWAVARDIPYEIIKIESGKDSKTSGQAVVLAVLKDVPVYHSARYGQAIVNFNSYGGEWVAEPVEFTWPFSVEILSASRHHARSCSEGLARAPDNYPCVRLTNRGYFDFKKVRLQMGSAGGTHSWEGNILRHESIDMGTAFSWSEIAPRGEFGLQAWGRRDGPVWTFYMDSSELLRY